MIQYREAPCSFGPSPARRTYLARQDDLVAMAGNGLSYELLRLAMGIGVGGVDQVDAGIQRRVHDVGAFLLVGIAVGAEHHGSEGVGADADAGSSERAVLHVLASVSRGWRRTVRQLLAKTW
jgi:hypothetical protein